MGEQVQTFVAVLAVVVPVFVLVQLYGVIIHSPARHKRRLVLRRFGILLTLSLLPVWLLVYLTAGTG